MEYNGKKKEYYEYSYEMKNKLIKIIFSIVRATYGFNIDKR